MKTIKITILLMTIFSFGNSFSQNYGYVNEQNVFVIEPKFYYAREFKEGMAAVRYKDEKGRDGLYFINEDGVFLRNIRFFGVKDFNEGYATVSYAQDFWGVLDKNGKQIITSTKLEMLASVKEGMMLFKKNGKYGFYNTKGDKVVKEIYDDAKDFSNGLAAVKLNGLYGFINKSGEVAIAIKYTMVTDFVNNIAKATIGTAYYEIDSSGKETKISKEDFDKTPIKEELSSLQTEDKKYKFLKLCREQTVNTPEKNQSKATFSSSTYALDIFKELGSMVIFKGSTMYVLKVKGKKMQNQDAVAARANQVLGFTTEFKYQWFEGNDCNSLKAKYGGNFTVICQGELDLDK